MAPLARTTGTYAWSWGHHNLCMICNWKSRLIWVVPMPCVLVKLLVGSISKRRIGRWGLCRQQGLDRVSALGQLSKGSRTVITELCLAAWGLTSHHLMKQWTRASDVLSHGPVAYRCSQSINSFLYPPLFCGSPWELQVCPTCQSFLFCSNKIAKVSVRNFHFYTVITTPSPRNMQITATRFSKSQAYDHSADLRTRHEWGRICAYYGT